MKKEKAANRKKTASKEQWVLEGNRTVIPKGARPSKMPINLADRRIDHLSPDGVPHQSLEDVLESKKFVDENHK